MSAKDIKRLAAGYAVLGLLGVLALVAFFKVMTLPPYATKADVKAAVGDPKVEKQAVDAVSQAAAGQGLIVESSKVVSDKAKGFDRVIVVSLKTNMGSLKVQVEMSKSVYSVKSMKVV